MNGEAGAGDVPTVASRARDYVSLAKPRLNAMAIFAVAAGWWVSAHGWEPLGVMLATLFGATSLACGASALNQTAERDRDALMRRTQDRPLPAGRLTPAEGRAFGSVLVVAGLLALGVFTTPLATLLGLATVVTYVWVYTPLKTRSSLNTLVGTVPGALPPLIGAAGFDGTINHHAWFLFAVVLLWQLPHFLAIAWLYREDYARAGFVMLPNESPGPGATARQVVVQGVLTVAVTLAAYPLGLAGPLYLVVALAAGLLLLACGLRFALAPGNGRARTLLRASILHLPLVIGAFVVDMVL